MGTKTASKGGTKKPERKSKFSTAVGEEALDFIKAIEDYKAAKERPFPSWTEVLQIVKAIGYRKVADSKPVTELGPK
ncbi:MAG: hypothetical protein HRU14_10140 [Planctomycetes bacterium]|nr:hypothetical protein [Planctomycetota bacterium]